MNVRLVSMSGVLAAAVTAALLAGQPGGQGVRPPVPVALVHLGLAPTEHPPVPEQTSDLWLVPSSTGVPARYAPLTDGVRAVADGRHADALALLGAVDVGGTPLAAHAAYYTGLAQLQLSHHAAARRTFAAVRAVTPEGALAEAAALREAEAAEAGEDPAAAVRIYRGLVMQRPTRPDEIWLRLGRAALAAGNRPLAAEAFLRVLDDYPLSGLAGEAAGELAALSDVVPVLAAPSRFAANLTRAERLFEGRRYADAREVFVEIRSQATGDDRALVDFRIAQCDYHVGRHAQARAGTQPFVAGGAYVAEARHYHALALRQLGAAREYQTSVQRLLRENPESPWTAEALDELATWHIRRSEDRQAEAAFHQILERFADNRRAERAAWRMGWWAYRRGDFADTARLFDRAAATFRRSDYRPAWLYWSARAHEALGSHAAAEARYNLAMTDYVNTYYGRLGAARVRGLAGDAPVGAGDRWEAGVVTGGVVRGSRPLQPAPPTEPLIRELLASGLWDDAISELEHAQRMWGTSPALEATLAYAWHRRGELRRAITLMRRAYPQFMAVGGEELPGEILRIIFPVDYWDLIRRHSAAHGLDPYLMAALVAQESTFVPDIRSSANAIGLMQIIPPTGRRLAQSLGISGFSEAMLTDPETNVRMGMHYFAGLLKRFRETHYALAGYNAGANRVVRWRAERPNLPRDEFIDDIPFPETQNYVKRILGQAEDYRRLYGDRRQGTMQLGCCSRTSTPFRALSGDQVRTASRANRRSASRMVSSFLQNVKRSFVRPSAGLR